jgi:hypothetical protein
LPIRGPEWCQESALPALNHLADFTGTSASAIQQFLWLPRAQHRQNAGVVQLPSCCNWQAGHWQGAGAGGGGVGLAPGPARQRTLLVGLLLGHLRLLLGAAFCCNTPVARNLLRCSALVMMHCACVGNDAVVAAANWPSSLLIHVIL